MSWLKKSSAYSLVVSWELQPGPSISNPVRTAQTSDGLQSPPFLQEPRSVITFLYTLFLGSRFHKNPVLWAEPIKIENDCWAASIVTKSQPKKNEANINSDVARPERTGKTVGKRTEENRDQPHPVIWEFPDLNICEVPKLSPRATCSRHPHPQQTALKYLKGPRKPIESSYRTLWLSDSLAKCWGLRLRGS